MGASIYIQGIRDLDMTFNKMADMKEKCDNEGFSYPPELQEYFDNALPNHHWPKMSRKDLAREIAYVNLPSRGEVECDDGLFIDVRDIPSDVKTINVYMVA